MPRVYLMLQGPPRVAGLGKADRMPDAWPHGVGGFSSAGGSPATVRRWSTNSISRRAVSGSCVAQAISAIAWASSIGSKSVCMARPPGPPSS